VSVNSFFQLYTTYSFNKELEEMKTNARVLTLFVIFALALAACSTQTTSTPTRVQPTATDLVTETAAVTETLEGTETPAATEAVSEGMLVVRQDSNIGAYLVEENGKAVYINVNDTAGTTSTCDDICAQTWVPVPYTGSDIAAVDESMIGENVDVSLLGTITRDDGTEQLTYNGWPLYTYVNDMENGDLMGNGMDNTWYLISPEGEPLEATAGAGTSNDPAATNAPAATATP
jgi:predicted lipoprotein with Yx(FWY)xxD motif